MLFALVIGLPAGIVAALKRNTVLDHAVMGASLTGYSMPIFWWGLLLILFFSVHARLDAGVRAASACSTTSRRVTGFMLIDSLLSSDEGAFRARCRT